MPDYPARQRFALALAAPVLSLVGREARELGGWSSWGAAHSRGEFDVNDQCREDLAALGITTRDELIAWTRERMHSSGERGWELAHMVYVIGTSVWAGLMTQEDAWHVLLVAAKLAQQSFTGWDAFADSYLRGHGKPQDLGVAHALWSELPWTTELDVTLVEPASQPRVLASNTK